MFVLLQGITCHGSQGVCPVGLCLPWASSTDVLQGLVLVACSRLTSQNDWQFELWFVVEFAFSSGQSKPIPAYSSQKEEPRRMTGRTGRKSSMCSDPLGIQALLQECGIAGVQISCLSLFCRRSMASLARLPTIESTSQVINRQPVSSDTRPHLPSPCWNRLVPF